MTSSLYSYKISKILIFYTYLDIYKGFFPCIFVDIVHKDVDIT